MGSWKARRLTSGCHHANLRALIIQITGDKPLGAEAVRAPMIAVVKTGGKQYVVREGQELVAEWIEESPVGSTIELTTFLVADEEGKNVKVGNPVAGKVTAKVMEHGRGEKVLVVKYKPKSRYRRHVGHRQPFTKLKIEKI